MVGEQVMSIINIYSGIRMDNMLRQYDIVKILLALTVAFILDEEPKDTRGSK